MPTSLITPKFYKRDFTDLLVVPDVKFEVNTYGHSVMGGPDKASITCYGGIFELWEFIEMLRAPIELHNALGDPVWWGFVNEVSIRVGAVEVGVSLDAMYNRVCVAYSRISPAEGTPANVRVTTDWDEDATSVAEFGEKEYRFSLNDTTDELALAMRDTALERFKLPPAPWRQAQGGQSLSATLNLRGWWETLKWKYYSQAAGDESYTDDGDGLQDFGDVSGSQKVDQSFELSASTPWLAYSAQVRMKTVGAPADNVILDLCSDSSGDPNAVLATATLAASDISDELNWVEFYFVTPYQLALSTTYHLVVRRSGGLDAVNYYSIDVNEDLGYASGVFQLWDGAAWVARGTDADMLFRIGGVLETTEQLDTMLMTAGQFFLDVQVDDASGLYSPQYRDGESYADNYVAELLKTGTSNLRRLLATVDSNRRVRIYEEPAPVATHFLKTDGVLYDDNESLVVLDSCPVGMWVKLKDVIPETADLTLLVNPGLNFIERAEYNPQTGKYTPTPRSTPGPWDLTGEAATG